LNTRNRRRRPSQRRSRPASFGSAATYWRWALPILLAALTWYLAFQTLPAYTAATQRERTLQALDRIAQLRAQAHQESDPARARDLLLQALDLLRVPDVVGDPERTAQLRAAVERDLATVNRVKSPATVVQLGRLPDSADRLVLFGEALYTLDRAGPVVRAWAFVPDRSRAASVRPDRVIYEGRRSAGYPQPDLAVVPEGQNRGLVLFTGEGLFLVRDGQVMAASIRLGPDVGTVAGLEGFSENLYLLDPSGRRVWRYLPTWNGFDADPKPALPYLPAAGVIGFAVDRVAFILGPGGRLWTARGNDWAEVDLSAVAPPATTVRILRADRQNQRVLLGDPEVGRLIILDYSGKFLGQVVAPELRGLTDLAVDGALNRVYIISQGVLYRLDLPELK
jgi:uncharacterized protein YmfQ (DUF2313 family)